MTHAPALLNALRAMRVLGKQVLRVEPVVRRRVNVPMEYHGTGANGWAIVARSLNAQSVVVDVGIGEDTSFPESLIRTYGCSIAGFDPTPRAIAHVRRLDNSRLRLFEQALAVDSGRGRFFLPANDRYVSGSLNREVHLGSTAIEVELVTIGQLFAATGHSRIDLLKLDIEGSEFDIIASSEFRRFASCFDQLCVEFHHRWKGRGKRSTDEAVVILGECGFDCAWRSRATNEEFTFVRRAALPSLFPASQI